MPGQLYFGLKHQITEGTGKGSRRGRKEEGKVDREGEGMESEGRESMEGWQIKN